MNNNKSKYYKEEDLRPNDFTFKCIKVVIPVVLFALLLYILFSFINAKTNIINFSIPNASLTIKGLVTSLIILLFSYIIGKYMDHGDTRLKYIFLILIIIMVTLVQTYMSYIMTLVTFAPLFIAAQYSDNKITKYAYVLSIISSVFVVIMNYEIGLCDANMIIFPTEKMQAYGDMISGEILPLSEVLPSLISIGILPRIILLTAFSPLINSIVDNRKEIILNEYQSRYKGEHDGFTGFYNRTKYNSFIENELLEFETVSLIFFDVNDLKYTNDNLGHDVGDKLILMASDSIFRASTEDMYIFRMGGDEFLVVIPNGTLDDAKCMIERWNVILKIINDTSDTLKCSIACGYAASSVQDYNKCLKQADQNMYKNKMFYKNLAINHTSSIINDENNLTFS